MGNRLKERIQKAFNEKNALPRFVARKYFFNVFQALGLHLTADHFYEIIPNTREVARKYSSEPRPLEAIDWCRSQSEERAVQLAKIYAKEYFLNRSRYGFTDNNLFFSGLDPLMLYAVARDLKPAKLVEIGQGNSTRILFAALERNIEETGKPIEFISIDPYNRLGSVQPPQKLGFRCLTEEAQSLDFGPLLKNCDFLFVDSSHVYKFGSDVAWQFTRLYPQLQPGTLLHLHDIYSPYDYPLEWIAELKYFWNEQYFLEAFLMFNQSFNVCLPMQLLVRQSAALKEALQASSPPADFQFVGSSFYLKRT